MICYNCGVTLTDESKTSEHIPAKNLYAGQPNEYKQNLLTVPACFECNNKFSTIDSEIRDMIGISNESLIENQIISEKTVRGLFKQKAFNRLNFDQHGQVESVTFKLKNALDIHTKNFKGIFFNEHGELVPDDYSIHVVADGCENNQMTLGFIFHDLLQQTNPNWKYSGHPSIFKYLISGFSFDENNIIFKDEKNKRPVVFAALLVYYDLIGAVVFCGSPALMEASRKK
ncbi:MAG: hypothetical protein IPI66_02680 [Chitinophagaceae bacterium]|nr:hypothetical protein [Chitinophagaceae bacterium]MBL0055088.1 hypothetical protein [Chitinophagaceae bacterium]